MAEILTPRCPVLTWDPTKSREYFLRTARQVEIQDRGEEGNGNG